MSIAEPHPALPKPSIRWFDPTPGRLLAALLAVEGVLWLSERFGWLPWHKGYAVLTAVAGVGALLGVLLLWCLAALIFRLRFQFSIRTLLALTVAVALPCSWLGTAIKQAQQQRAAVDTIEQPHGKIYYDWQVDATLNCLSTAEAPGPEWLRTLLGVDFFSAVVCVWCDNIEVTDAGLDQLAGMTHLQFLWLDGIHVTDAGLAHLEELSQLQELWLDCAEVTDSELRHLACLTNLRVLKLSYGQVTDSGLARLNGLKQLEEMELDRTKITDAGLKSIGGFRHLRRLSLSDTAITDAGLVELCGLEHLENVYVFCPKLTRVGVERLQRALPKCEIHHNRFE
jgi:hypothetical protein